MPPKGKGNKGKGKRKATTPADESVTSSPAPPITARYQLRTLAPKPAQTNTLSVHEATTQTKSRKRAKTASPAHDNANTNAHSNNNTNPNTNLNVNEQPLGDSVQKPDTTRLRAMGFNFEALALEMFPTRAQDIDFDTETGVWLRKGTVRLKEKGKERAVVPAESVTPALCGLDQGKARAKEESGDVEAEFEDDWVGEAEDVNTAVAGPSTSGHKAPKSTKGKDKGKGKGPATIDPSPALREGEGGEEEEANDSDASYYDLSIEIFAQTPHCICLSHPSTCVIRITDNSLSIDLAAINKEMYRVLGHKGPLFRTLELAAFYSDTVAPAPAPAPAPTQGPVPGSASPKYPIYRASIRADSTGIIAYMHSEWVSSEAEATFSLYNLLKAAPTRMQLQWNSALLSKDCAAFGAMCSACGKVRDRKTELAANQEILRAWYPGEQGRDWSREVPGERGGEA